MLHELEAALHFQKQYEDHVAAASDFITEYLDDRRLDSSKFKPEFGLTLGSGLDDLTSQIEIRAEIPYNKIPSFPVPTTGGHAGIMVFGRIRGVPIIGLRGRTHYYEVANEPFNTGILKVVFAVNVLANLGVENYFTTNAVGGLNPTYCVGDVMVLNSHINLIPNPLLGLVRNFRKVDGDQIDRFLPMNGAYDREFRELLTTSSLGDLAHIHHGRLLAVTGPTYETEAECVAFRDGLFVDAVGMSAVPEVIAARSRGIRCVGFSCITNKVTKEGVNATNHGEVVGVLQSQEVRDRLSGIVSRFFELYSQSKNRKN